MNVQRATRPMHYSRLSLSLFVFAVCTADLPYEPKTCVPHDTIYVRLDTAQTDTLRVRVFGCGAGPLKK